MKKFFLTLSLFTLIANATIDENLPNYKAVSGISGSLNTVGSDTLNNLMALWSEKFREYYPNVVFQIEGKGSSTAPPALISGTTQLAPMSRSMKQGELDKFEVKFGYKPTPVGVAIDALAVFVHKDNPLEGLNLRQLDSLFSSTYKRGGVNINNWEQLNVPELLSQPVKIYGRNSASGTYGFFKKVALKKGDYKSTVNEQPGSSAVVNGIANNLFAIGYSGIGYKTSGVKILPIASTGKKYQAPTLENCISKKYPLARTLWIYINKKPGQPVDRLTSEFLRFILSKEGQQIVEKDGYYPLTNPIAQKFLNQLLK